MTRSVGGVISRVTRTIARYNMMDPGDCVGIGFSGGSDSAALLDILATLCDTLDISLVALHLNHGIRGEEADRDEAFAREQARRYGLPFIAERVDTPAFKVRHRCSLEEAARIVRYRFFERHREIHRLRRIALGHTADDQAETVLMRIITGGDMAALKGIPPVRDETYIRPLFHLWRREIGHYIRVRGIPHVEDSSNRDTTPLRNRLRHELIPRLQRFNPEITRRLVDVGELCAHHADYIRGWAHSAYRQLVGDHEPATIPVSALLTLPVPVRREIIRYAFSRISSGHLLQRPHVTAVLALVLSTEGSKEIALPGNTRARRLYDTLILEPIPTHPPHNQTETILTIPGRTTLDRFRCEIDSTILKGPTTPSSHRWEAYLDWNQLSMPLRVRGVRPGDTFVPLGMKGRQKIKDFFIDHKIPKFERTKIPLVVSGDKVCWIAGWRLDERFKLRETTSTVLKLAWYPL